MRLGTRVLGNKTHYLLILQNFPLWTNWGTLWSSVKGRRGVTGWSWFIPRRKTSHLPGSQSWPSSSVTEKGQSLSKFSISACALHLHPFLHSYGHHSIHYSFSVLYWLHFPFTGLIFRAVNFAVIFHPRQPKSKQKNILSSLYSYFPIYTLYPVKLHKQGTIYSIIFFTSHWLFNILNLDSTFNKR